MHRQTIYRNRNAFVLEPRPGFTPVILELQDQVELRPAQWGSGLLSAYAGGIFGQPIPTAIQLGWCRIVETR